MTETADTGDFGFDDIAGPQPFLRRSSGADAVGDWRGIARQREPAGIEWIRKEHALADNQQVSTTWIVWGRLRRPRVRDEQRLRGLLARGGIHRTHEDPGVVRNPRRAAVDEMAAVAQHEPIDCAGHKRRMPNSTN